MWLIAPNELGPPLPAPILMTMAITLTISAATGAVSRRYTHKPHFAEVSPATIHPTDQDSPVPDAGVDFCGGAFLVDVSVFGPFDSELTVDEVDVYFPVDAVGKYGC